MNGKNYTIKPGLLVGLKTRLQGGVQYVTMDEQEAPIGASGELKRWTTERTVDDVAELARATELRGKASSLIRGVCIKTPFGLLCPADGERALQERMREARGLIDSYNATAQHTRVDVYVITGAIAQDDREAVRAILSDVRDAVQGMRDGIESMDADKIRDAATRARNIGRMLDPEQEERVGKAVKAARAAARQITKRVEKAGEEAAKVRADIYTAPIDSLRFSFLDLDGDQAETPQPAAAAPAPDVDLDEPATEPDDVDLFAPVAVRDLEL